MLDNLIDPEREALPIRESPCLVRDCPFATFCRATRCNLQASNMTLMAFPHSMGRESEPTDNLSRLPEEIIEMIARETQEHIISLRSTCRDVQHKSRHAFLDRFFAHRHIWMDESSLNSLNKLADHPDLIGFTKQLTLHLHQWDEDAIWYEWHDGHGLSEKSAKAFDHAHVQWHRQEFLLQSGRASAMLSSILRKTPILEEFKIPCRTDARDVWPHSHFKTVEDTGAFKGFQNDGRFFDLVWAVAIQALSTSNLTTLKSLHVGPNISWHGLMNLGQRVVPTLPTVLASLKTLHLTFSVPAARHEQKFWQLSLVELLRCCMSITDLELRFQRSRDPYDAQEDVGPFVSRTLAEWPTFPHLAILMLSGEGMQPEHLVEFLQRHQGTLRVLDTCPCGIGDDLDDWEFLLRHLRSGYNLDRLRTASCELEEEDNECYVNFMDAIGSQLLEAITSALKPRAPGEYFCFTSPELRVDPRNVSTSDSEDNSEDSD